MYSEHPLKELVRLQKIGIPKGICSICSSHPYVIEAAIEKAIEENSYVLIESTANQVNQFGGYTGLLPIDFAKAVKETADKKGLSQSRLILGGDHLGPLVWKNEAEDSAMEKAAELIKQYVKAGFSKIHIDTSMRLGSDPKNLKLDTKVIARRAAKLYAAAESAFEEIKQEAKYHPVYVIGSEVPVPGGTQEDEDLRVTDVSDLKETLRCFREAFADIGSSPAMENVIAVVVQPGVEFGEGSIHEYNRYAAHELSNFIKSEPNIVFEGHSTDYQRAYHLKQMVEDGVAILKVGPALTFALREGLLAIENIERELLSGCSLIKLSEFSKTLDEVMEKNPAYWESYYNGSECEKRIARKYSLSDRCRYYLGVDEVEKSIERLVGNLKSVEIPLTLISQYIPQQYNNIREGKISNNVENLIKDKVRNVIDTYQQFSIVNERGLQNGKET